MISIFILSIIQGISEFLPISSSAHLIIFRDVFLVGKEIITPNIELTFDVALHFGTVLAILVYFYKDFINIIKNGIKRGKKDNEGKLLWYLIISTIPAALIGVLFDDIIENYIRNKYYLIAISLILVGIIIYIIDKYNREDKQINNLSLKDSLIIGISQVFALIPGFSRSGTTIATARLLKINRKDSALYSFYLSTPIVLGALILQLFKTDLSIILDNIDIFIYGVIISFIVGLWSIRFLLNYLKNNDFKLFMWYRLIFGLIVILILISS